MRPRGGLFLGFLAGAGLGLIVNRFHLVMEVVIPEVDAYTYGVMCANAGTAPAAKALTATNIYVGVG